MDSITLQASARIHTALLNESGYHGRIDGSIGFSIDSPSWKICLHKDLTGGLTNDIDSELLEDLELLKAKLRGKYSLPDFSYGVTGGIETHIGLGSKTSLLMGFGNATSKLFGLNIPPGIIAIEAGRGGTSGIGYWASQQGGFLWDAGRNFPDDKSTFSPSAYSSSSPPALIASIDLPGFYVCHFRFAEKGIYGSKELSIFNEFCPTSHEETKELLTLVSGLLVPSLLSSNEHGIQIALANIQTLGLKAIEWNHQDKETLRFKKFWESRSAGTALCLSSMGPTMYCLTHDPDSIRKIIGDYPVKPIHLQTSEILNGIKQ